MTEKIIIAGAGGQGVMLMGKILAEAAMRENKNVTWLPSYGAEVRGGAAYCMVVISDEQIGSPFIEKADTLVIMSGLALDRFSARLKNKGLLLINSSLVSGNVANNRQIIKHPFTALAVKLGNIKVANMIALGAYLAKKKITGVNNVLTAIEEAAPREKRGLVGINKQAVYCGLGLIKGERW